MATRRILRKRSRIATYIDPDNAGHLKALSDASNVSAGRIIDQALDAFFKEIDWREPATPPVSLEHFKEATKKIE